MRSIYIWTTRFILAIVLVGILPVPNNTSIVLAQSKKAKASQASKYAKRGNAKAKKKDYRGALSDYKKAYKLSPSKNYKKKVQQLTSLAKKTGWKKIFKQKGCPGNRLCKKREFQGEEKRLCRCVKGLSKSLQTEPFFFQ